jgi:16S rRNA (uracil1498-N3)-methyltransferase
MSLHRFFLEKQVLAKVAGEQPFALDLTPDDARHARVLRLQPGERIAVVDGAQNYYVCEVVSADAQGLQVRIAQVADDELTGADAASFEVALVAGVGKQGKLDDVIRAATELGVSRFMPFLSSRTVVKLDTKKSAARRERWQTIAKSAAMQSGAPRVPQVDEPLDLQKAAPALADFDAVVIFWEEAPQDASLRAALVGVCDASESSVQSVRGAHDAQDVQDAQPPSAKSNANDGRAGRPVRVACVVGPEGGLSADEIDLLLASNPYARLASLGPSILRTETAGVVACALCIYELGGLGAGDAGFDRCECDSEVE